MITKRRVLFHRTWTSPKGGSSGGQLKVRDAFEHFTHSEHFEPKLFFGKETIWGDFAGNHWLSLRSQALSEWEILPGDVLFFSGSDWQILSPEQQRNPPVPILNIAQPRHIHPDDKRHDYLKNPAIRIAKSTLGKKILEDYGVNGPVYCIPDAIDLDALPPLTAKPDLDILIIGLKNQPMAESLHRHLKMHYRFRLKRLNIGIQIPPALPTRKDFLQLLNRCRIAIFLPLDEARGAEGFYLPALEAMALGKLVICPFAVGNIDFCIPNKTCIQPDYNEDALFRATVAAIEMPSAQAQSIIASGLEMSKKHSLGDERQSYLNLLNDTDEIWNQKHLFWKKTK